MSRAFDEFAEADLDQIGFTPTETIRQHERAAAERSNAWRKDEFGGNTFRVKGDSKVTAPLRFGILGLSADQLL